MEAESISTGLGQGQAQILKPQEDLLDQAIKQAQLQAAEKKAEKAATKAKAMDMLTKMGEHHIWTQRDGEKFKEMQDKVWKGIMGKDLDDPATMLWLTQQAQDLTFAADKSNADKELWTAHTNKIATEGADKYLPGTVDYLFNFADKSNALGNFDASKMMKRADIEGDMKTLLSEAEAQANANAQQAPSRGTIPGAGGAPYDLSTTIEKFNKENAENLINKKMLEPAWRATMELNWQQDPNKANYSTVDDYARAVYAPRLIIDSKKQTASRITESKSGAGAGATKYGNVVMDVYDDTLAPDEVAANPELGQYLLDNPDFKAKYESYRANAEKAGDAWPKDKDGNKIIATAAEFAANLPQKVKLIPISRPNEAAPSEMSWKDKNGFVIKGRFKQLVDYNGHLVVNVIEERHETNEKTGEKVITQNSVYVPLTADNFGQINQEFSDKDVPNGVAMQLADLGYGDQISKFKIQSTSKSKAPSGTKAPGTKGTNKPSDKSELL